MDIWSLLQIALNLVFAMGLAIVWTKLKRPPQDDPRLSRGLQLLQSKISVLEDLSDRTDRQVEQLTQLLEQKARQLQTKIFDAENQLKKVDQSMHRSLEVAEIFQDKIPHGEIIERQNTVKYVLAAQLAHKGLSVEEILQKVDLPREHIEFIAKVNKEELMFDETQLPEWAKTQLNKVLAGESVEDLDPSVFEDEELLSDDEEDLGEWGVSPQLTPTLEGDSPELDNLKKLGEEFRQACYDFDEKQKHFEEAEKRAEEPSRIFQAAQKVGQKIINSSAEILKESKEEARRFLPLQPEGSKASEIDKVSPSANGPKVKVHSASKYEHTAKMQVSEVSSSQVKKVSFPRIDLDDHLG